MTEDVNGNAPRRFRRVSQEHQKAWGELYKAGLACGQIARLYDRPESTVYSALIRLGVPIRPRGEAAPYSKLPHSEFERTRFLYERVGMSINEISRELGIYPSAVRHRLQKAGVQPKTRSEGQRLHWKKRKLKQGVPA